MIRNASGHIVKLDGSATEMLKWLSQFYNFTYSAFQTNTTVIESKPNQPGLISHLLQGDIDILISIAVTRSRMPFLDFSHPALYIPISYLIPVPDSFVKVEAVVKPFQPEVWLALTLAIPCVVLALSLLYRNANIFPGFRNPSKVNKKPRWGHTSFYVLGTLLNQGGYLYAKFSSFYWVGGAWCIVTFVIVNAYNSTLISHVTLPNAPPLIKSIYDLRNRPDVRFVTERNLNVDAVLLSADTGFLKFLGDRLREYPQSRCNSTRECVEMGITSFLYRAMKEDYDATGQCNLQLKSGNYFFLQVPWAFPKQSQHMKYFNRGIMQMREAGLVDFWIRRYQADARKCLLKQHTPRMKKQTDKQLGLDNLIDSQSNRLLISDSMKAKISFSGSLDQQ
ncbi:glutamate receptor ionotropic, kainate 3-like [Daphnia magna]|uniref:glutamate receptor ionotropic, kainate 3-like n=1 Tax=Daphnia magna TaxID=35525 RepID=UPI001E1BD1F3|nr:glutamate receptor ionotropic, kainate 3-like [Daphnia magna]